MSDYRRKPAKIDATKPLFTKRRNRKKGEILTQEEYDNMKNKSTFSGDIYSQLI